MGLTNFAHKRLEVNVVAQRHNEDLDGGNGRGQRKDTTVNIVRAGPVRVLEEGVEDATDTERRLNNVGRELAHGLFDRLELDFEHVRRDGVLRAVWRCDFGGPARRGSGVSRGKGKGGREMYPDSSSFAALFIFSSLSAKIASSTLFASFLNIGPNFFFSIVASHTCFVTASFNCCLTTNLTCVLTE